MINEKEILEEIQQLIKKTELISNPSYNNSQKSISFWKIIDNALKDIKNNIEEKLY